MPLSTATLTGTVSRRIGFVICSPLSPGPKVPGCRASCGHRSRQRSQTDQELCARRHHLAARAGGFYLVEALDQDRSVYRLYHEQFAEHLRAARSPGSAQERITAELLRHVPAAAEGRREWAAATPYIRTHLATHAAKARMLDQLVNDPGFLLAADPARLLPALATVTDPEARKSASAFESTQDLLRGQPAGQAAAQLDLAARVHGAVRLADGIGHLPYKRPWTIAWGHWPRPDRHVVLSRQGESVQAVAAATLDGAPVAVTCSEDGVRVWDLRTGAARWEAPGDDTGPLKAVAAGEVDGTPVAVTGGDDGTVRVWDLRTGAARWEAPGDDTGPVDAVAVGKVDGTPVAVTGSDDVRVWDLRVWDLRTGMARGEPLGHTSRISAVAVGEVDGTPVAVTGCGDGVRVWDLRTGAARFGRHIEWIQAVAVGEVDGTPVAVTGGHGGVWVWDLRAGAVRWEVLHDDAGWITAVAVGEVDGTSVAVTGDVFGTVRVWDLRTGAARGEPLHGHSWEVKAVAVGEVDGTPVAVTGSDDGTVRVWDLRAAAARREPLGDHTGWFELAAVGEVDGIPVAVTCSNDGMRLWDLQAGAVRWEALGDDARPITSVAVGQVDGTPVAVTGGNDGTVRVWDLGTGVARGKPLLHGGVFHSENDVQVAVGEVDGTPVAVTGDTHGTVRVWDLRTGKPLRPGGIFRRLLLRTRRYSRRREVVKAFAVGAVDGTPVAVTGGADCVRVWDLPAGAVRWEALGDDVGWITAVAVGEVDGTPVAVSGDGDGTVRVWDLRTGAARGKPLRRHTCYVTAVAVGEADGIPVAVSGDTDGTILMWDLDCDQRVSARLDAPGIITAVAFAGRVGWPTSTSAGSFIWRPAPIPGHAPRR